MYVCVCVDWYVSHPGEDGGDCEERSTFSEQPHESPSRARAPPSPRVAYLPPPVAAALGF